jgi:glycosyltransferase involved in cell wall biosynthesis
MKHRLVIITEIIAPYRIPVFNALAQHPDIELKVIFLAKTDPSTRQWRVYADEIRFTYEILPSWRTRLKKYNLLLNQKVVASLQKANPVAIVCGGYNYLASWQALRWAKQNDVPFLLWCESTANDKRAGHRLVESLKRNFFDKCVGCIVPGIASGEYACQMGISPENIFVAPNAVDNDLFGSRAEEARRNAAWVRHELNLPERYFIFAGRLVKSKGVFETLEAYSGLDQNLRSQVGLVFAGDGPLRLELERVAKSIHPGTIRFSGFVQRDDLANYYGLADCLVFPTQSDPWGLVVNEAMACGLPVICGRPAGCAADLVKSNGRLIDSRNVEQLAHAMEELASDEGLLRQMSRESLKIIRNYSPEVCATGIAQAALTCCSAEWAFSAVARSGSRTARNAPALSPELHNVRT